MLASGNLPPDLAVVIPVYNEQDCIVQVLTEWREALSRVVPKFCIIVIDDGSKDGTAERVSSLAWPELILHRQSNRGHGQSCLVGYELAAKINAPFVFQIDSDGQCDPAPFPGIWEKRNEAVAVYGRRTRRDDGAARRVITVVLRFLLKLAWRTRLNDTNVPYRLYHSGMAAKIAARVPRTFDLANIAVALLMEQHGYIEVPIHFRDRLGGHPSVKWWGFGRKAIRLCKDLRTLPKRSV